MRAQIIIAVTLGLAIISPVSALADCFGGPQIETCTDASGNTYTVNRFGNMTTVNGSNAQTGSQWNQTTTNYGNMTQTTGTTNGAPWSETQTQYGNGFSNVYGTNSQGQPYNYNCSPYSGCQ